jgi:putative transposase
MKEVNQLSGPQPPSISASPLVRDFLEKLSRSRQKSASLVFRATLILKMLDGLNNSQLARHFDVHPDTPRLWRKRWLEISPRLELLEAELLIDDQASLANALENYLRDEPRPGTPATFTPEQIVALLALACESPQLSGYSFEHWTPTDLAREAKKRGLVQQISPSSVWRFLKRDGPQTTSFALLAQHSRK